MILLAFVANLLECPASPAVRAVLPPAMLSEAGLSSPLPPENPSGYSSTLSRSATSSQALARFSAPLYRFESGMTPSPRPVPINTRLDQHSTTMASVELGFTTRKATTDQSVDVNSLSGTLPDHGRASDIRSGSFLNRILENNQCNPCIGTTRVRTVSPLALGPLRKARPSKRSPYRS